MTFAVTIAPAGAVINGDVVTDPNEYPWFVTIKIDDGTSYCGGTLVDKEWVLTAQHCVRKGRTCEAGSLIHAKHGRFPNFRANEHKIRVYAHATKIEGLNSANTKAAKGVVSTTVTQVRVPSKSEHPYLHVGGSAVDGDVALLKLKKRLKLKKPLKGYIPPVTLGSASHLASPENGRFAAGRILGHGGNILPAVGRTCDSGGSLEPASILSPELRLGVLIAKDSTAAGTTIWESLPFPDYYTQNGMAPGDSGGPVLVRTPSDDWIQVGVMSGGTQTLPMLGYSARLDYFWQFINRVLGKGTIEPEVAP